MLRWCLTILLASIVLARRRRRSRRTRTVHRCPRGRSCGHRQPGRHRVSFTCPVYRVYSAGDGFDVYGGPKDYGLSMSTSPALGGDGRLADPVALVSGATSDSPDHCVAALAAGGAQRPQETPGTYYWQVWRLCTGCTGSYEVGPVRRWCSAPTRASRSSRRRRSTPGSRSSCRSRRRACRTSPRCGSSARARRSGTAHRDDRERRAGRDARCGHEQAARRRS